MTDDLHKVRTYMELPKMSISEASCFVLFYRMGKSTNILGILNRQGIRKHKHVSH